MHYTTIHQKAKATLLMGLLLALSLGSCHDSPKPTASEDVSITANDPVDTLQQLVSKIQKCSRLYTSSFKVHRIITHSDQLKLKGVQHQHPCRRPQGGHPHRCHTEGFHRLQ